MDKDQGSEDQGSFELCAARHGCELCSGEMLARRRAREQTEVDVSAGMSF
jgi:hypothetical protein